MADKNNTISKEDDIGLIVDDNGNVIIDTGDNGTTKPDSNSGNNNSNNSNSGTIDDLHALEAELQEEQNNIMNIQSQIAQLNSTKSVYNNKIKNAKSAAKREKYQTKIINVEQQLSDYKDILRRAQRRYDQLMSRYMNLESEIAQEVEEEQTGHTEDGDGVFDEYSEEKGSDTKESQPKGNMKNPFSDTDTSTTIFNNLGGSTDAAPGFTNTNLLKSIYHPMNIFQEDETDLIHKRYRYGVLNAYQGLTNSREFLFFTKPDLNIIPSGDNSTPIVAIEGNTLSAKSDLNGVLCNYPFWTELCARYPGVIECLQASLHLKKSTDPFNHLLENMVQSNIDVPGLSAEMTETPTNTYGVGYNYRGSSEASDDGFDFSLEFKDTKYLHVYNFFKAYEEYETLKHHGVIAPWIGYIERKILHDQFCIYKFVVGDDGETLIYYAKYYGVKSKSLPRDVFNANTYENGLSYSVDFNAAFVEDMNPLILSDFNQLSYNFWNKLKYNLEVHDFRYDQADNRAARGAVIVRDTGETTLPIVGTGKNYVDKIKTTSNSPLTKQPGGYCYKIKWKGDDEI